MSAAIAALCAIAVSALGIGYLLAIDEKRRRVFRLGSAGTLPRSRVAGWAVVLLPGAALIANGRISELLVWFGAMTVGSWLIVSRVPGRARE